VSRVGVSIAVAGLAVTAACQSERLRLQNAGFPTLSMPERAPVEPLRVATFNAGLAPGVVKHAGERAPEVVSAIAAEDLDLVCVQEFWLDEHWTALRAATSGKLPHVIRPAAHSDGGTKPCAAAELAPVARCALKHCWSEGPSRAAECAMHHCGSLAERLAPQCLGCLGRHPLRRVGEILEECVDPSESRAKLDPTQTAEGPRFFDGSYGIGLLSSDELSDGDQLDLEAAHHLRAVLYGKLGEGDQRLHVFCTHLSPILQGVPHPGGGSWASEQSRQVDALLDWVDRKAGDQPALILGDLNTGPGIARIRARLPEHYARFVRAGFINPYLDGAEPTCTLCYDNPVIGGRGDGLLLDHVLVRGFRGRISARRFLDGPLELAAGGRRVTTALSDHYGVIAELSPLD
jgi:endonuclease/exonuclease/phosphatase family metal-dependent hydrolase